MSSYITIVNIHLPREEKRRHSFSCLTSITEVLIELKLKLDLKVKKNDNLFFLIVVLNTIKDKTEIFE